MPNGRRTRGEDGMAGKTRIVGPTRRTVLKAACVSTIGFATTTLSSLAIAVAADEEMELVRRLTGKTPTESDRVRLEMPPVFANGYTVPLALEVDSPMTEADHVRLVRVFARSEEHTSELQSLRHLVCRLLLEKKKTKNRDGVDGPRRQLSQHREPLHQFLLFFF